MEKPKSLESLFTQKIFRIPDYQRGYSWQRDQLKAFWEDLVNLPDSRSHYTGVLTIKKIEVRYIPDNAKEFWLVDDYAYHVYHIVDGQQRLTTFVILVQAFVDFFKRLPENKEKASKDIFITESLSLEGLENRYLFKVKPTGGSFRTYKFGYTADDPSDAYLRFNILHEAGAGQIQETFYTLNLGNAKYFFSEQLRELQKRERVAGIQTALKKLTRRFLFNEYVIDDELDVFVAFETMNNRGRKLSNLELLKNRLIYLTTLFTDTDLDVAGRQSLRDHINDAWREVYHQLGRNKARPLNDDDFLRALWISYFKYSRKTGRDYAEFLLDEKFTPQNVHKCIEREVTLDMAVEQRSESELDDSEDVEQAITEFIKSVPTGQLGHDEIRDFVTNLKEGAVHWFTTFYRHLITRLSDSERLCIEELNRVGMGYFRPMVMVVLKKEPNEAKRIQLFKRIERFIFLAFRIAAARSNYRSSEFYNLARDLQWGETSLEDISAHLDAALAYAFNDDGTLRIDEFYNLLFKKFREQRGYYGWSGINYFLYEYEQNILSGTRQKKVDWGDLLKPGRDKLSIEHIYPQTPTDAWEPAFTSIPSDQRNYYNGSLGNLLLLSLSINASLQNDAFADKKEPKIDANGKTLRNGYSDGSHSEIEVARHESWGPDEIRARGLKLLEFMERRWNFKFKDDADRKKLLFLDVLAGAH